MAFFFFLLEHPAARIFFEFAAITIIYLIYCLMSEDAFIVVRYDETKKKLLRRFQISLKDRLSLVLLGALAFLLAAYSAADCAIQGLSVLDRPYPIEFFRWGIAFTILAVLIPKCCFIGAEDIEDKSIVNDMVRCIFAFLISALGEEQARRVLDNICDVWDGERFSDEMVDKMLDLARKVDGDMIARGREYAKLYFAAYLDSICVEGEILAWTPSEEESECHAILREIIRKTLCPSAQKS